MANRIRAKDILKLDASGLSGRAIATSLGVSRNSVRATLAAARQEGLEWEDVKSLAEQEVYDRLFPEKASDDYCTVFAPPFHAVLPQRSTIG